MPRPLKYPHLGRTAKVAFHLPAKIITAIARAAKLAGHSRSEYVTRLLARSLHRKS